MFRKKSKKQTEITTAALPDIVFLLLFFFMVSATIRPPEELLKTKLPQADAISKVNRKELIREINIGIPKNAQFGTEPKISVESRFIDVEDVSRWAVEQKESLPENLKDHMIVLIRSDELVHMGLIADIQEELKKVNARKVVYRTLEE